MFTAQVHNDICAMVEQMTNLLDLAGRCDINNAKPDVCRFIIHNPSQVSIFPAHAQCTIFVCITVFSLWFLL